MTDNLDFIKAVIHAWLKYNDTLLGNLGSTQTPNEFFGLSGKHGATNHFNQAGIELTQSFHGLITL
jgi:hypothetical protein